MNTEQTPILVPVDFSQRAAGALFLACKLAGCSGQPLVVMHVVHESTAKRGSYQDPDNGSTALDMNELAREQLEAFLTAQLEQRPHLDALKNARTILVDGLPATRILEVADREGAGMIVMGSHGRNGIPRLIIGSVAEDVMRRSQIPVTIFKSSSPRS